MKSQSIPFICLLLIASFSCKKEESQPVVLAKQAAPAVNPSIENSWWHGFDNSEHSYFDSNGRYYYMKNPAFNINDTAIADCQGYWNWINGDTLFINYPGVQQGVCVAHKPHKDTLKLDVNVKGNYPLIGYPWMR